MKRTLDPFDAGDMDVQEIEQAYADLGEQMAELDKLVKKYQTTAMTAKEKGDPETLSNTLIRLARVNSALGGKAAYAKYIARNAERAYRRTREQIKLQKIEEKNAIGKAESLGYVADDTEEVFKIWSNAQLLADTADDMAYRTDTFMKMSQSGLSLIKKDLHGT